MKLVTFVEAENASEASIGVVCDGGAIALLDPALSPAFQDMLALIDAGEEGLAAARAATPNSRRFAQGDLRLLAPLPRPRQMRDALSFELHLRQARSNRHLFGQPGTRDPQQVDVPQAWYDQPVYYKCNRFSVVGHEAEVRWPKGETRLDYELELGLVIGKGGRDIASREALEHVFGYVIFNDFSARDLQMREMSCGLGPAKGKDFDTGNALGPWLVTADEIGDPHALEMIAHVNGEERSRGSSSTMHHGFNDIIAHISRDETLYPGEFIGSGTIGDGCGLENGRFLEPRDVVELEIERLGVLRNRIGRRPE